MNALPGSRRARTLTAAAALLGLALLPHASLLRCPDACLPDLPSLHGPPIGELGLADIRLNAWILASVQRNLVSRPFDLFAADAYHPAPRPLAGSEHMLGLAVQTLPLRAFTDDAAAVYLATQIMTAVLLAWGTLALAGWLTGSLALGLLAGVVALLLPWRWQELMHLQLLAAHWFPLIWLLTLRTLLGEGRRWELAALGVLVSLQLLTSYYLAYQLSLSLALLAAGAALQRAMARGALRRLLLSLAPAYALLVALSVPFLRRSAHGEIPLYSSDSISRAFDLSSRISRALDRIAPRLHFAWDGPPPLELYYSIPLGVGLLAGIALWGSFAKPRDADARERRARVATQGFWLYAAACLVLMFGPGGRLGEHQLWLPSDWAVAWIPGFASLRAPWRWSIGISLAAPVLAALGLRWSMQTLGATTARTAVSGVAAALLLVNLPWGTIPAHAAWTPEERARYEAVRSLPEGPLLEIPWAIDASRLSRVALATTLHGRPTLNGYTAYPPRSDQVLRDLARRLPEPASVAALARASNLRWILVRPDRLTPAQRKRWLAAARAGTLARRGDAGDAWLFELPRRADAGSWVSALTATEPGPTTLAGLSRSPLTLPPAAGSLESLTPEPVHFPAASKARIVLRVANRSRADWPGLDPWPEGLVELEYYFEADDGSVAHWGRAALDADLPGGRTSETTALLDAPRQDGEYRLCLRLVQRVADAAVALPLPPVSTSARVIKPADAAEALGQLLRWHAALREPPLVGHSPCRIDGSGPVNDPVAGSSP